MPQNLRDGLNALLNNPNASEIIKDYIDKYAGRVGERNGGINSFYGTFDLKISKRFKVMQGHQVELSGDIFNVANLLKKNGCKQIAWYIGLVWCRHTSNGYNTSDIRF